jgi:hypothetical protein
MANPYQDFTVSKPYWDTACNRYRIRLKTPEGRKTSTLFARYLMEVYLGRFLTDKERVHHKDEDTRNDSLDNLELTTLSAHGRKHHGEKAFIAFVCPACGRIGCANVAKVKYEKNKYRPEHYKEYRGPFCSKDCATWYRWHGPAESP